MKLDILAVGIHPDDIELSCTGTLLKHIDMGYQVGLLDLSRGELGTRGNATLRTEEALEAARLMGAKVRVQLDIEDGFFTHNETNLRKIIGVIRKYCPDIILANAVEDRHPDHGRAAKLTADACFLSGLTKVETFDTETGLPQAAWRPKVVYHYIQDRHLKPDVVVDITPYMERKFDIIMAYKSQFYNPASTEPMTPISSKSFLEAVAGKDTMNGRLIGATYGEGFTTQRAIGVSNLMELS